MTTPRTRAHVSVTVAMTVILTLGACVRASAHPGLDTPMPLEVQAVPLSIRFDNDARDYVHVYLIGQERQWFLGRVEAGAVKTLRIPEESLRRSSQTMQLAVIVGDRLTMEAARNPRAKTTIMQPVSALLSQQWTFAQGEITSRKIPRAR